MTTKNANAVRANYTKMVFDYFERQEFDVGMISSNSFNIPVVSDGEEGWIEIVVKVPKDEEGYEKRDEYQLKLEDREEKARIAEEKKKAKIAKDEANRKKREEKGE